MSSVLMLNYGVIPNQHGSPTPIAQQEGNQMKYKYSAFTVSWENRCLYFKQFEQTSMVEGRRSTLELICSQHSLLWWSQHFLLCVYFIISTRIIFCAEPVDSDTFKASDFIKHTISAKLVIIRPIKNKEIELTLTLRYSPATGLQLLKPNV